MILPTIVSISREVIRSVPDAQREAMFALGATRWEVDHARRSCRTRGPGIVGAVILGLGRALGETMAVTMVIGNGDEHPDLDCSTRPRRSRRRSRRPSTRRTVGLQTSSLIALGLILLVITIILNVIARLLVWRVAGPVGGE